MHFNFVTGIPQAEFGERVDHGIYGLNMAVSFHTPVKNLNLGVGLNYLNYGWENRSNRPSPEVPDVRGRLRVTNNIFFPYIALRVEPDRNRRFAPYAEVLGGINYLYTQSFFRSNVGNYRNISFDEMQLGYGLAAGIRFRVIDGIADQDFKMSIVLCTRYLRSPEISYLREGDLLFTEEEILFNEQQTGFDLLSMEIGIVFQL